MAPAHAARIMERRFTPLAVVLGLAVAALLARLWDIQVLQHDVWARESANLVRAYEIDPYVRGTIRDRKGRPIVRDEEVYALEFVWREFRRGHPLGQVAMLRSLAALRPVGLDETRMDLREAALSYASLTPDDLEDFAVGEALDVGLDFVPALIADDEAGRRERARDTRRRSRANDIAYYLHQLLGLSRREVKALRKLVRDVDGAGARTFLDLAGEVTDQSTSDVAAALADRVLAADERLTRLAALVDWPEPEGAAPGSARGEDPLAMLAPGDRLVALVEEQRQSIANEAADALFTIAAGFSPTRLSAVNLRRFDLEWLRVALDWDRVRLDDWIRSRGDGFAREVDAWLAGHTIARAKIVVRGLDGLSPSSSVRRGIDQSLPEDGVISAIAHAFRSDPEDWARDHAAPQDWRQVDEIVGVTELPAHLAHGGRIERAAREPMLPFQLPEMHTAPLEGADLIAAVLHEPLQDAAAERDIARMRAAAELEQAGGEAPTQGISASTPDRLAELLLAAAESPVRALMGDDQEVYGYVLEAMHARLQAKIAGLLDEARGSDGLVKFADGPLKKAKETRAYVLRDRGGRSRVVGGPPDIELVLLVSRYQSEFAGFRVTTRTRRTPVAIGPDGESPVAKFLIGKVRSPFLVDVLSRRPDMAELGALQRKLVLPDEDRSRILGLIDSAYRDGETVGGLGLEAWFERELSGEDGYVEWHGLQDLVDGNREPIYRGARDGEDVALTLDIDLQRAAEEVLLNPMPPEQKPTRFDDAWFEAPVGAIVLARVSGEILAAASVPLEPRDLSFPWTDGQAEIAIDRTLRKPSFQPPGSVMKPIVAAYALEHLGLDPGEGLAICLREHRVGPGANGSTRAGYGAVDCNVIYGHSNAASMGGRAPNLGEALLKSCNTYFAALADTRFTGPDMADAYRTFGFGRPTGVRFDDDGDRSGLLEWSEFADDVKIRPERSEAMTSEDRQRLGNGLTGVETTVVQVARAYAGLATGTLPQMSLVDRIGQTRVPPRGEPIGISEQHLEIVRSALRDVVGKQGGSANGKGLDASTLGFEVAVKTGSADYGPVHPDWRAAIPQEFKGDKPMRKHTWIAGWFPSREPRYVVVVYNHDTLTTASRGAVFVAQQFLARPEIRALVAEDAADAESAAGEPIEAAASRGEGPR